MTACPDCTKARAGTWGVWNATCPSCVAREISRSRECKEALSGGEVEPLSAMVDAMLAGVPREQAVGMVREWVRVGKEQR